MAYVQKVLDNYSSTEPATFSVEADTTAGNFLVAVITLGSSRTLSSVTDSNSNTWNIDISSGGARSVYIASARNTTALTTADTITFDASGTTSVAAAVYEYSGVRTTLPFDAGNYNTGTSVTALNTGSATTGYAIELAVTGVGTAAAVSFTGPPASPYIELAPVTSPVILDAAYQITSATGDMNATWSWDTAYNAAVAVATYIMDITMNKSESVTVTDTPSLSGIPNPSKTDNVTVTDTVALIIFPPDLLVSVSDTVNVTELIVVDIGIEIVASEAVGVTELIVVDIGIEIVASEAVGVTETIVIGGLASSSNFFLLFD